MFNILMGNAEVIIFSRCHGTDVHDASASPYLDDSELPHFHTRSTYLIYNTMTRSIVKKNTKVD